MKRVRVIKPFLGKKIGQEYDLGDMLAKMWVANGWAEVIEEKKRPSDVRTTRVASPPEHRAMTAPQRRRKK